MSDVDTGLPPLFDSLLSNATDEPLDTPDDVDTETGETDPPTRTRKPRSDKGQARGPRGATGPRMGGRSTSDKKLAEGLLNPWAKAIKAVAYPMPTLAAVMTQQGESTMNALVSLASPKMKAALAKAARIGPGADLIESVAMMIIAAAMDIGKVPPNSPLAVLSGVQSFFDYTHPETSESQTFAAPQAVPDNVHPFPRNESVVPGMWADSPEMSNGSMFTPYPGDVSS